MNAENDETGTRRALMLEAHDHGHESAEALYRSLATFRDTLPDSAKKQLAAAFEWAREGINRQPAEARSGDLASLSAAYAYARDVLIASLGSEDHRSSDTPRHARDPSR